MRLSLVIDCADPDRLAAFWAPALGYSRLDDVGPFAVLIPPNYEGGAPVMLLQRVTEPKQGKNRVHIDIHPGPGVRLEDEVARLVALGARQESDERGESVFRWIVMTDPEGNEFCACLDP